MKKSFILLAILFLIRSFSMANDITINDCESIEIECIGTSLWCEPQDVI